VVVDKGKYRKGRNHGSKEQQVEQHSPLSVPLLQPLQPPSIRIPYGNVLDQQRAAAIQGAASLMLCCVTFPGKNRQYVDMTHIKQQDALLVLPTTSAWECKRVPSI
jgi:hypothetical protein